LFGEGDDPEPLVKPIHITEGVSPNLLRVVIAKACISLRGMGSSGERAKEIGILSARWPAKLLNRRVYSDKRVSTRKKRLSRDDWIHEEEIIHATRSEWRNLPDHKRSC